jgi:ribA/ribD-fused uncharacterized protein
MDDKAILFNSRGAEEFRFLSNFHHAPFNDSHGTPWPTSEHYYQAMKCKLAEQRTEIWKAPTARDAKRLGGKCVAREDWDQVKLLVMWRALCWKFQQNPDLARRLVETGDRPLVEYAPWGDTFWGVDRNHEGRNWMGQLLMALRKELS